MKRVKDMRRAKKPVIHGDATDAEMLHKAHLTGAKGLILTLPQAEKNLLIALLAKEHNPAIVIHARADTEDYVSVLRKAGVSIVVVPEIAAVDMLLKHVD
jgi:Trk K+ transport system NAD-binding subunit